MATYSFLDVSASLVGPGGAINLGTGIGSAEEGITIEPNEDIGSMTIGADGTPMHNLHADKSGTVTIRLLKTSPANQKIANLYAFQTANGANHGNNAITIVNVTTHDAISCQQCGFKRAPTLTYAKEGGINEWTFNAGVIDRVLGSVT